MLSAVRHLRHFVARRPPPPHHVLRRRIALLATVALVADVGGTVAMYGFEQGAEGGKINVWTDALFFSTVQLLTISSQLPNPVTGPGRVTDVLLEVVALFLVSALAGAFASFLFHLGAERQS
jgi:hypothetical protein